MFFRLYVFVCQTKTVLRVGSDLQIILRVPASLLSKPTSAARRAEQLRSSMVRIHERVQRKLLRGPLAWVQAFVVQ